MKGQLAIEFMFVFIIFLLGVIFVLISVWNSIANAEQIKIEHEANRIISMTANRINTAYLEGDGFSINLVLPESIFGYNYTFVTENDTIWLHVAEKSFYKRLLTSNITGILSSGENKIKNIKGMIVIS
jgi:CDP-diglyceride synthetase